MKYGLEYILIRTLKNGKVVDLPISEFSKPKLIEGFETDDINEAMKARMMFCEIFKMGYVRIAELSN